MGDRAAVHPDTFDQQPSATRGQPRVSVNHEGLRIVKTSEISTTPEVLAHVNANVTNLMAEYT